MLSSLAVPVVQAPMAGGTSTTALAAAVCGAGGLGFVAGGYLRPDALAEQVGRLRALTAQPFGVNLFLPGDGVGEPAAVQAYRDHLAGEAERYGVELPAPRWDDDDAWAGKVEVLVDDPVAVVSFTFAPPPAEVVTRLRRAGSLVLATVTSPDEATVAAARGVDGLVVQSRDAGAHSGTYSPGRDVEGPGLVSLVRLVRAVVDLPVVAAGGLADGADVAAVLDAGAVAAQLGTLFLRTPESGARQLHKDALVDPRYTRTTLTRAFSGRPARALVNRFVRDHDAAAPTGYPVVHHLTTALRAAAAVAGDPEGVNLWAGSGHRAARDVAAARVVADIADELADLRR